MSDIDDSVTRVTDLRSLALVDPALRVALDAMPNIALSEELLPEVRARAFPLEPVPGAAEAVGMEVRTIPGPEGAPDVGITIYRPLAATGLLPAIFHIHGGGYVAGAAANLEPLHRPMAWTLECMIVSVDYRLAPETRFPGAIEDCYAALAWSFNHATDLGIDATRIGVMGESAGGGLAAALALLARDRGKFALAFQHLIYPMLDDRTCASADPHPYAGEFLWTPHNNAFGWSALLGKPPGSPDVSPYAAAARATDLSRLPPTFISTGALDLFIEEDMEYARRLMRHGVPVELHVYPGAYHAFDVFTDAPIAHDARRDSLAALRRALRGDASSRRQEWSGRWESNPR
jgi:acetyl esterase/lipase